MLAQRNAWDFEAGQTARQPSALTMMPNAGKMRHSGVSPGPLGFQFVGCVLRTETRWIIQAIISTPGLEVLNGRIVENALQYYSLQNVDFMDAYIVALMQKHKIAGIYSFDKKNLDRITHVTRLEP